MAMRDKREEDEEERTGGVVRNKKDEKWLCLVVELLL